MQQDSPLKLVFLVTILMIVAPIGVGHVVKPDWFIKRSGVRKGGELLTEWNRVGFQILGVILAAFAACGIYALLQDYFSR